MSNQRCFWRPGSSRPRLCLSSYPALPRVTLEKSKPSVALAAGFIPAATMSLKSPSVASSDFRKIPPYTGKREQPRGEAAHAMRGNHHGSLSHSKKKGQRSTEPRRVTDLRND